MGHQGSSDDEPASDKEPAEAEHRGKLITELAFRTGATTIADQADLLGVSSSALQRYRTGSLIPPKTLKLIFRHAAKLENGQGKKILRHGDREALIAANPIRPARRRRHKTDQPGEDEHPASPPPVPESQPVA
ncbi:hypothetical protein ACLQ2P_41635, partial [Actinomadura citrea]|uniref:hypothetical protein n=1 Tax=Actinomadura citrea TaxID=46158 RepID=UPI003CE52746